jgi:hypothetical protein
MADEIGEISFSGEYTFAQTVNFEGQKYEKVEYDLTKLRAADVIAARYEASKMRGAGKVAPSLIEDDILQASLVAISAGLPAQFILQLDASDFVAWSVLGQLFLAQGLSGIIAT